MKTLRQTKMKGWYEFYRETCPICNHAGGCMIHEKGDRVACIRSESKFPFSKNSAIPSWLHWLNGKDPIPKGQVSFIKSEKKKEDGYLHEVYTALLDCTVLSDEHFEHLTSSKRQLSTEQIYARGYRTLPQKSWNTVKDIFQLTNIKDFTGVPGFHLAKKGANRYWTINSYPSILIPFRNQLNEIVGFQTRVDNPKNDVEINKRKEGLQVRVKEQPNLVQILYDGEIVKEKKMEIDKWEHAYYGDETGELLGFVRLVKGQRYFWLSSTNRDKGTSPGDPAPIHVSVPSKKLVQWKTGEKHKCESVWLSEGPLKCDIAVDLLEKIYSEEELKKIGDTMLALPGVGSWRLAIPMIKEMEAKRVNICFDADMMKNIHVKKHLFNCVKELQQLGVELFLVIWNEKDGKGIDDIYLNRKLPSFKKLC